MSRNVLSGLLRLRPSLSDIKCLQGNGGRTSRVTIYAQVDDLQAYLDKAERLGGKTVLLPMEIPDTVTLAMFTDPEGNLIGLIKG